MPIRKFDPEISPRSRIASPPLVAQGSTFRNIELARAWPPFNDSARSTTFSASTTVVSSKREVMGLFLSGSQASEFWRSCSVQRLLFAELGCEAGSLRFVNAGCELLGQNLNLRFAHDADVAAGNFENLQPAAGQLRPSCIGIMVSPQRFLACAKQRDGSLIGLLRIQRSSHMNAAAYILQRLRQEHPVDAALPVARILACLPPDVIELVAHWHSAKLHQQRGRLLILSRESIKQGKQSDLFAAGVQQASHLKCDGAAERQPSEKIRPFRLNRPNRLKVVRGHVLDASEALLSAIESLRLQPVHRLIWTEVPRQVAIDDDRSSGAMHAEERRFRTEGLNGNERRPGRRPAFRTQQLRHVLDRGSLEQRCDRHFLAKHLLQPVHQPHGQQRVPAQIKETLPHSDRMLAQNRLPDAHQLRFERIFWRGYIFRRSGVCGAGFRQRSTIHLTIW